MLRLVPDHLKTKKKKMCKHAVKKLPFVIRYILDRFKTQHMCNKAISENGRTLESVPDWYKTQEMCDKTVDNYAHALEFVPDLSQFLSSSNTICFGMV